MALGFHGHPGAAAASPVVEEEQLERVPARLPKLAGSPAWERAKKAKIAKLGNARVGEISLHNIHILVTFARYTGCFFSLVPPLKVQSTKS